MDAAFGPALKAALENAMNLGEDIPPGPIGQFFLRRGVAQGRLEALAKVLVELLHSRHLEPTSEQLTRIQTCSDASVLERWVVKAAQAETVEAALA